MTWKIRIGVMVGVTAIGVLAEWSTVSANPWCVLAVFIGACVGMLLVEGVLGFIELFD